MFFSVLALCGTEDSDGCSAEPPSFPLPLAILPFLATAAAVGLLSSRRLFPYLSSLPPQQQDDTLPMTTTTTTAWRPSAPQNRCNLTLPRAAFAALLALAATFAEVILLDLAGLVGRRTREAVLGLVVPAMVALLVLGVPALELRALVAGWKAEQGKKTRRLVNAVLAGALAAWVFVFWTVGGIAPSSLDPSRTTTNEDGDGDGDEDLGLLEALVRACLTRIGIIGITLMALLSGFASVSTPWHLILAPLLAADPAPTESDIDAKQTHLDTTSDMLLAKRQRLQALERKVSAAAATSSRISPRTASAAPGLMGKMMGALRTATSADELERRALRVEIAALETVEAGLANKVASLRARYAERLRAATPLGRLLALPTHVFAIYCLYRVCATAVTGFFRCISWIGLTSPSSSSSSADPVSRIVALVAWHWDPVLDEAAWVHQISFLLSGAILLASLSSAMQTVNLFSRAVPAVVVVPAFVARHARASAALLVAQLVATYVVSAALLLRSSLLQDVVDNGAVGWVLRGVVEPAWVERWFDGWFLVAACLTGAVIWIGRKLDVEGGDEDGERDGFLEKSA